MPYDPDKHRDYMARRSREKNASVREIGDLPPIGDIERRRACEYDLARFCETYASEGKAPFSDDHLRVIRRLQDGILEGGRFCLAVYRGFGKSTLSELAVVWAVLYGHKRYIPLVGSTGGASSQNLDSIKGIIESEMILDDFPGAAYPIAKLENVIQKASGQTYQGKSTRLSWSGDVLRLPWIDKEIYLDEAGNPVEVECKSKGAVILCRGLDSRAIRGMKQRRADGVIMRPDFAIIDDPQTDESARSPDQCKKRWDTIHKAIIRSAGHMSGMSIVMPCSVIAHDDLVDQILDPDRNPAWQGERISFVKQWSKNHDMWMKEYADLRNTYDPESETGRRDAVKRATEFYVANRAAMDEGCVVSWEHCYESEKGEVSAIQHAYNALIDDGEEAFACEFQNAPLVPEEENDQLTHTMLVGKLSNLKRGQIPKTCEVLTAFVDVQGKCLYWTVCAWGVDFSGHVIDYGVYPEGRIFSLRDIKKTLSKAHPGMGQEGRWRAGLDKLADQLLSKTWKRDDGVSMKISRMMVDANDGSAAQTITDFCQQSPHAATVMPARGVGITAGRQPFSDRPRKPGERKGLEWRITKTDKSAVRHIISDVNFWKTFVRSRLQTAKGDPGSLYIYGLDARVHAQLFDQLLSESSTRTEGRGRTVDEWRIRPGCADNHFWDCLVGCAIGASEQGITLGGDAPPRARKPRKRVKLSEVQKKKGGG